MAPTEIQALREGVAIPACPLALDRERRLDERHQRALVRYYAAAGAGGLAVGVHTTQFAIRAKGLFEPVLAIAAEEMRRIQRPFIRIGGICGETPQAAREAATLVRLNFSAGLLGLGALRDADDDKLIAHCQTISQIIPIVGFYLQPAAGGRPLPYSFWRRFAEIQNVVAIKIAPFNRYQTLDVIRAVAESGRDDIALYTGNDDNIVLDLITPYPRRIVGGLLGHWAVWTKRAVETLDRCKKETVSSDLLKLAAEVTDMNAALFDAANNFAGCIPGINEVLRRQGLLATNLCLDPHETLGPGQAVELDRAQRQYPHLIDDEFVRANLDSFLR